MSTFPESKISLLKDRAQMFAQTRAFFSERDYIEVDCPALNHAAPVALHIDVMKVTLPDGTISYLHTSPEYGMKRLLAMGLGNIYQLSHVFREGEFGPLHNPEFTMVEWYRLGARFKDFIEETLSYLRLFLGNIPSTYISYREALKQYAEIDYVFANTKDLIHCAKHKGLTLTKDAETWDKDTLLQCLVSFLVEPHLGKESLCVLYEYPASQAALAQVCPKGDENIAERFEVYYKSIELANGYHELTDAKEQKRRLEEDNALRQQRGKDLLKVDNHFLHALEKGLPDCCGVAVGFDRLMLLRHQKTSLAEVLPFSWDIA